MAADIDGVLADSEGDLAQQSALSKSLGRASSQSGNENEPADTGTASGDAAGAHHTVYQLSAHVTGLHA